jgi:hypothetical protein
MQQKSLNKNICQKLINTIPYHIYDEQYHHLC